VDECALAKRLMAWDTSNPEGIRSCAGFIKGWLEARDVDVEDAVFNGRPVLAATVGAESGPTLVFHGHLDVVPAHAEQFEPRVDGDRLYGRGAYDMKGALAAMMVAAREVAERTDVRVHFVCVADEESDETELRASDWLVKHGYVGDFAITGEPTDMYIGVQAKGVLALRLVFEGRAAHGSTPWQGDNAVLKALHGFRRIEQMGWAQESSELFPRASVNLGRIMGGDALNKVPDRCAIDLDIRYLPGQEPGKIQEEIASLPDVEVRKVFHRQPILVEASNPHVQLLAQAIEEGTPAEHISVGRDGTSDAISFLEAGVPAVEFGPVGAGHHGPEEWVSLSSLQRYRKALVNFVELAAAGGSETTHLRIA
jgi:succinyl-diaminopimelate desuccinylase